MSGLECLPDLSRGTRVFSWNPCKATILTSSLPIYLFIHLFNYLFIYVYLRDKTWAKIKLKSTPLKPKRLHRGTIQNFWPWPQPFHPKCTWSVGTSKLLNTQQVEASWYLLTLTSPKNTSKLKAFEPQTPQKDFIAFSFDALYEII